MHETPADRRRRLREELHNLLDSRPGCPGNEERITQVLHALKDEGIPGASAALQRRRQRGTFGKRMRDNTVRYGDMYEGLIEVAAEICDAKIAPVIQLTGSDEPDGPKRISQADADKIVDGLVGRRYRVRQQDLLAIGLEQVKEVIQDDPLAGQLRRAEQARKTPRRIVNT